MRHAVEVVGIRTATTIDAAVVASNDDLIIARASNDAVMAVRNDVVSLVGTGNKVMRTGQGFDLFDGVDV